MSDKYMTGLSAKELLDSLETEGFADNRKEIMQFLIARKGEKEMPLYLRILLGVGAFISSLCLIGFLVAAEIISFRSEVELNIWGIFFIIAAVVLQRTSGQKEDSVKHCFMMQSSFCAMATGKTLFVAGVTQATDTAWGIPVAALIITILTYNVYKMSTDRFLSSFAVLFSLMSNILWNLDMGDARIFLVNAFFLLQVIAASILLTYGKAKRDYIPLFYAFVFSLCVTVVFLTVQPNLEYGGNDALTHPVFINLVLTISLIALIGWAAGKPGKLKKEPLLIASCGAVLLGVISAPGVLLAIGLLIMGYAGHEKLLLTMGGLIMPVSLFFYYYNMDLTLDRKSAILVSGGLLLLAGRCYLRYRKLDAEV